jgi:hypothetical protein
LAGIYKALLLIILFITPLFSLLARFSHGEDLSGEVLSGKN